MTPARWDSSVHIKRHTWQASGLVLGAFLAGIVVGVLL